MSNSLWPHGLQHARLPCPLLPPRICSNSCPLSRWCHPIISSSVTPFSSCLQSFPASGSFPMSWFFTSGGQNTGTLASASVFPINLQGLFPFRLTGLVYYFYILSDFLCFFLANSLLLQTHCSKSLSILKFISSNYSVVFLPVDWTQTHRTRCKGISEIVHKK